MVYENEKKTRIGELLINKNLITKEQLAEALRIQKETGEKIGEILIKKEYISSESFVDVISKHRDFEIFDLDRDHGMIDPSVSNIISKDFASKRNVFAFNLKDNNLCLAMINPRDINIIDEVRLLTGYSIRTFIATNEDIEKGIKKYMSDDYSLREVEEITQDEDLTITEVMEEEIVEENPVIKLANQIINKAISTRSSDVHVEPQEENCVIRFRVDGVLQKIKEVPKVVQRLLISRYKIMGGMDITESRLPQDGRSSIKYQNRNIDLRFASIPAIFGENITIRILDKDDSILDINNIGMVPEDILKFTKMISAPYGSVIITGPTGSGKTTTLYASLKKISSTEKKIFTIEDPVEYRLPQIMQIQVNSKIGMDFSKGLKAMLRSDPDIIMVGEMRDIETVRIVMEASITGHLVLTTLHTNDAPSSLTRLLEMGAESYMISAAVRCIVAQRLLRKLCPYCKEVEDTSSVNVGKGIMHILEGKKIYKKVGCKKCGNSGYIGRIGIYSVLVVSKRIREMILKMASTDEIRTAAREEGMKILIESAAEKIAEGLTSIEEMYRVVF